MNKYQEALDKLCSRCYVESEECTCHARYKGGKCYDNCEYKYALQELVDKETPKKIVRYSGISYDYNEIDFFACPNCRNLYKGQKYCDECGQALSPEIYDGEIDEDRSDE